MEFHAHSSESFDSQLVVPELVSLAHSAGLTNLAITDHDTIEGALHATEVAPEGLSIIVGQEVRSDEGDLIGLFLTAPIQGGMSVEETSEAIHDQGGLVGLPHGFDAYRPSIGVDKVRPEQLARIARLIDYVEVYNARVRDARANQRAAEFASAYGIPGVAASDSHRADEVGVATTALREGFEDSAALLNALGTAIRLVVTDVPLPVLNEPWQTGSSGLGWLRGLIRRRQ